jgi:hypothetical protein
MTDLALEWMSFRRSGNVAELTEGLAGKANTRRFIGDVVTLGHAEWTGSNTWRIAAPVLAGVRRDDEFAAVLCGARTSRLLDELAQVCSRTGAHLNTLHYDERPSKIMVTAASPELLSETAVQAGLPLQGDAAFRTLACTPSIRMWPRTPCPMVQGRVETVRRFSKSKIRWVESTLADASNANSGFFRIQRDWDWVSLIKHSAVDCAVIDDRAGRMAIAAKSRVLRWSRDSGILSLPAQLYPPGIMARGLTLCSGELPTYDRDTGHITFSGVRPEHMKLFIALTGLRLI